MRNLLSTVAVVGVMLTAAVTVSAQTLAELAKREAERRKAAPVPAKTYTNDDLKQLPPPAGTATSKTAEELKAGDALKPAGKAGDPEKVDATKPSEPAKDEAYWRGRITAAHDDIRRNEAFLEAMQTRVNALTADFTARDDPSQRAKIAEDRQKALAEMARLKEDIEKGKKLVVDIEEEARRAGVPPGWIR
jgi:hypothetical protein